MGLSRFLLKSALSGGPVVEGQLKLALNPLPEGFIRADRAERPFVSVRLTGDFVVLTKEDNKVVKYLVTPSGVTNVWLKVVGRLVEEETADNPATEGASEPAPEGAPEPADE